jgi:predicted Zn-dependent peptidase
MLGQGRHARLHTTLVAGGLAARVDATATMAREPYVLNLEVSTLRDADAQHVEDTLLQEVASLATGAASEVGRVKRRLRHAFVLGSEGATNHARLIGRHEMAHSYHRLETYLDELECVTAEDVQRVAWRYLAADQAVVGWALPDGTNGIGVPASSTPPGVGHLHP